MYHKKNDKRSLQSCESIYMAFYNLVLEKPYDHITVKDIIESAQVARATFYRNFDHIEDILQYKVEEKIEALEAFLRSYYQRKHLKETDAFLIVPVLKFWYMDSSLLDLLIQFNKMNLLKIAFSRMLEKEMIATLKDQYNPDLAGYMLAIRSGIALHVLEHWISNGKEKTPNQVVELLLQKTNKDELFGKMPFEYEYSNKKS